MESKENQENGNIEVLNMKLGLLRLHQEVQSNLDTSKASVVIFIGNYGTGKSFTAKMYLDIIKRGKGIVQPDDALIIPEEGEEWYGFWKKLQENKQLSPDLKKLSLLTFVSLPTFWPNEFFHNPSFIYIGFQANQDTRLSNLVRRRESDLRHSLGTHYSFKGKDYIHFIIDTSLENRINLEEAEEILATS